MKNIKEVFDTLCENIIIDQRLIQQIRRYEQAFVNKNEHHVNFFGGVLMGVNPVRFTPDDRQKWFDEIIQCDEFTLKHAIHALPSVNTSFKVSSDIMNLSCVWLIHRILTENKLPEKLRDEGALLTAQIMNYKFFTSILTGMFSKYNASPAIAQTTYAMLTKKFGLKVAGSWGELIRRRSYDIVKKGGLHYNTLLKFDNDKKIVDMTNDIWGRVKSILKYIRDVFTTAMNQPEYHIQTTSNTITLDGEVRIRDRAKSTTQYMNYILMTLQDRRSFIVRELVGVVMQVVGTTPVKVMDQSLDYLTNNASIKADKDVQAFVSAVVEHGIAYLTTNPGIMRNRSDLAGMVRKIKFIYTAAKTTDPSVLKIRTLGERIVSKAANTRNQQLLSSARTSLALYVLLRTMVMHHYKR